MRAGRWTEDDLRGTGRAIDVWWQLAMAGVDPVPERLEVLRTALDRSREVLAGDGELDEREAAARAAVAALSLAGRAVHDEGHGPPPAEGTVAGVFTSGGGVPKQPVDRAVIGARGVEGDHQAARKHHGRVWQALCLWSADVVERLAAEGHPIFPGACGENVSIAGVDWAALRPGTRLRLGSALAEVTVPSIPCKKNAQWFADGDFNRMHHERERGISRQYALVVEAGEVAPGDAVVVEPYAQSTSARAVRSA